MHTRILSSALFAATALGLAANARAAQVEFEFSNPEETTEIDQVGTLGKFDTNLGTLTKVTLTINVSVTTETELTNNASETQMAGALTTISFTVDESDLGVDLGIPDPLDPPIEFETGLQEIEPGEILGFGPDSGTGDFEFPYTPADGAKFDAFESTGPGSFDLGCMTLSSFQVIGGGGNVDATQETTAACSAMIVYEYDPDIPPPILPPRPVPAVGLLGLTGALLGLGLAGLARVRGRRKQ